MSIADKVLFSRLEAVTNSMHKFTLIVPKKSYSAGEFYKIKADFKYMVEKWGYTVQNIEKF